jgi:hypothetical protein
MDDQALNIFGKVAGLGGLSLGIVLLLFREVIRKNIFPKLQPDAAYLLLRLITIAVWSIALTGIAAWAYVSRPIQQGDVFSIPVNKTPERITKAEGKGCQATKLPQDAREAARLYKLSADQGDACGQAYLGEGYAKGLGGLPKDEREAARLFKLSADQGNSLGQVKLGYYYAAGLGGLPKDEREAARLYKLSADQGNSLGQVNLAAFYTAGLGGLPKDAREAARLFKLAVDQGDSLGQAYLGYYYAMGLGGLPKDEREAARLYKLARIMQRFDGYGALGAALV